MLVEIKVLKIFIHNVMACVYFLASKITINFLRPLFVTLFIIKNKNLMFCEGCYSQELKIVLA